MNLPLLIQQVLIEWPIMIRDLKKIDSNLSKRPNKTPSHASNEHLKLIDTARQLAEKINLKDNLELLSLEMFVEWTYSKHDPNYRIAKWYAMLSYLKAKYGTYKFPTRTSGDNRESQYYNMISLLRNTYRGKTKSIALDESLLKLPKAKEWICNNNYDQRIYTCSDWQKVLDFSIKKYGFHLKPKATQKDKEEYRHYQLLQRIKRSYKKGNVLPEVFDLPKAEEWIKGIKPSDSDIWLEILSFSIDKLGFYSKPRINSTNLQEKQYAIKIQNWRNALIKGNKQSSPDQTVLNLPMAREWLLVENSPFHQALSKWPKLLNQLKSKGELKYPKASSTDPLEKEFHALITYFKNKFKRATSDEIKTIYSLEKANDFLDKTSDELKSCKKWEEMLQYLHNKYGFHKLPQSRSKDPNEKAFYNFIHSHKRRVRQKGTTYKSILELPMAREWLFD